MVMYLFLLDIIAAIARVIIRAFEPIISWFIELSVGIFARVVWTIYLKLIFEPFVETTYSAFLEHGIDAVMSFGFVDGLYGRIRVIGIAVFLLVISFQLLKSMFAYMGLEADDPLHIGMKAILYGFLIYYSRDICSILLNIFSASMKYLMGSDQLSTVIKQISNTFMASNPISIEGFCYIYLSFKLIMVTFRFAERYAIMLFLVIMSPLAFACGPAKATNKTLQGWFKLFVGNLVVQLSQMVIILSVCKFYSDTEDKTIWKRIMPPASLDVGLWQAILPTIFMIAMVKILEKVEDLVKEAQFGVGVSGGPLSNPITAGLNFFVNSNPVMDIANTAFNLTKGINAPLEALKNLGFEPPKFLGRGSGGGGSNASVGS